MGVLEPQNDDEMIYINTVKTKKNCGTEKRINDHNTGNQKQGDGGPDEKNPSNHCKNDCPLKSDCRKLKCKIELGMTEKNLRAVTAK